MWLKLLVTTWQSWLSGGGVVGLIFVLVFAFELRGKELLTRKQKFLLYIPVFAVFASFAVWENQYLALKHLKEEANRPQLKTSSPQEFFGYSPAVNAMTVALLVHLKNTGTPSSVDGWSLDVSLPNKTQQSGIVPTRMNDEEVMYDSDRKPVFTMHPNMRLEEKTLAAIPQGVWVNGWLRFRIPNLSLQEYQVATLTLHYRDITDRLYSLPIKHIHHLDEPLYVPGSGDSPLANGVSSSK